MKKFMLILIVITLLVMVTVTTSIAAKSECATIQDGTLKTDDGANITTGFDQWGYNYQASMFNGGYCDSFRGETWCQIYEDVDVVMQWNDAFLSNKDCDGDNLLDKHYGYESYIGSGAWLTDHQKGTYERDGVICTWEYYAKVVAVPEDADLVGGVWYTAEGVEIGPVVGEDFAIIQSINNDPCWGYGGVEYKSPSPAGFGNYYHKIVPPF